MSEIIKRGVHRVHTCELTKKFLPEANRYDNVIRIYRTSPERVGIQIRSHGPIGEFGKGKFRRFYSMAVVDVDAIDFIINNLKKHKRDLKRMIRAREKAAEKKALEAATR